MRYILGMSVLPDSVTKLVPKIPEKGQKRLGLISKSASVTISISGCKSGLVEIFYLELPDSITKLVPEIPENK